MSLRAELDRMRIYTLRDLSVHPSRHLASVVVVTVCSGLLIAVLGIFGSIVGSVDELAEGIAGHVSLQITANSSGGVPADVLKLVRRVDGVQAAAPIVISTVPVDGRITLLIGVDPSMSGIDSRLGRAILDQQGGPALTSGEGIVVGSRVPAQRDGKIEVAGQRLDVAMELSPTMASGINDGRFIIAPMRLAQDVLRRSDAFDSILIATGDNVSISQVRDRVDALTQGRVITSEPLLGAAKNNTMLVFLRASTLLCASLALLVAMFFVFNTLNMTIIRRRSAFAMMRAIGARPSEIWRYVVGEAVLVGFLGGMAGAPLGIIAGRTAINSLPQAVVQSVQANVSYHLPTFVIPLAVAVTVASCALAAIGGVRLSGRLSPIEAVGRADIREVDVFTQPWRRSVGAASTVLLSGAAYAALHLDGAGALIGCVVFIVSGLGLCYAFAELLTMIVGLAAARLGRAGMTAALVIARSRGRVWLVTMATILAVAVGVCASGQMSNFVTTVSGLAAPLRKVPLIVAPAGSGEFPTGPLLPRDVQQLIQAQPTIARVTAGQYAYGTVNDMRVLLHGVSPDAVTPDFDSLDPGTRASFFAGTGVVISRQLGRRVGVDVGGKIALQSPTGEKLVKVVAVVNYVSIDAGLVILPLSSLTHWYSRPGATYLEVYPRDGTPVAAIQQALGGILPAGLQIRTGEAVYSAIMSVVAPVNHLSIALQLIIAAVVAVGIFTTFLVSVIERRREIAVFRAMGASGGFTVRAVLAEAVAVGLVGGLVGTVIGLISQYVAVIVLSNTVGLKIDFRLDPTFVWYPAIAVLLCMTSAAGAAAQAARLNITEAISDQ